MKIVQLLIILSFISCQMTRGEKNSGSSRNLASLFKSSSNKISIIHEWKFDSEPLWIVQPTLNSNIVVQSIEVLSKDAVCSGENTVKVQGSDHITFYLTKSSYIKCHSSTTQMVSVKYNYFKSDLNKINDEHLKSLQFILEKIEFGKISEIASDLDKLGLKDLYQTEVSISELNQLPFQSGDLIHLEIVPQLKKIKCPDGKCELNVNVFGLMDYSKMTFLQGMNQLKHQDVPAFLFFCGSQYTAGNIYFRADEKLEFEHTINENGFSCDVNSFLLSNNEVNYSVKLNWLSKEKLQNILMGKQENFIKLKDKAIEFRIRSSIAELQKINDIFKKNSTHTLEAKPKKGHIELWWEPFAKCLDRSVDCEEKEMVMTRSRIISQEGKVFTTKEISLTTIGLKQTITSEEQPLALVVHLCPEDLDEFLFQQLQQGQLVEEEGSFRDRMKSFEKKSCQLNSDQASVAFDHRSFAHRWLLASTPKEVERDEVEFLIEDYQLLEAPSEKILKSDPFQRGRIFFDIYFKNLKNTHILFKRSRIIEMQN